MKKSVRILSLALVIVMVALMFTSCGSKYPALKKAFEEKGYTENTSFTGISNTIKAELEKDEYAVELYLLTKSNGISSVMIVEFKSTKDMVEAYEESATIQGLVTDISKNEDVNKVYNALVDAGYACGNCLCIPMSLLYVNEITNVVKSVK